MTKYHESFKQQVIEFYLQNGKNRSLTRQHFQLKKTTFSRWLSRYHHDGINGLAVLVKKQKYLMGQHRYCIQTKAGNIKWRATENCVAQMVLRRVCQEREIV